MAKAITRELAPLAVFVVVVLAVVLVVLPAFIASMIRLRLVSNTPIAVCLFRAELASSEARSAQAI